MVKRKTFKKKGLDTKTVVIAVVVILIGLFIWVMVSQGYKKTVFVKSPLLEGGSLYQLPSPPGNVIDITSKYFTVGTVEEIIDGSKKAGIYDDAMKVITYKYDAAVLNRLSTYEDIDDLKKYLDTIKNSGKYTDDEIIKIGKKAQDVLNSHGKPNGMKIDNLHELAEKYKHQLQKAKKELYEQSMENYDKLKKAGKKAAEKAARKAAQEAAEKAAKEAAEKAAKELAEKIAQEAAEKGLAKGIIKGGGKVIARFIPGVGWILLATDVGWIVGIGIVEGGEIIAGEIDKQGSCDIINDNSNNGLTAGRARAKEKFEDLKDRFEGSYAPCKILEEVKAWDNCGLPIAESISITISGCDLSELDSTAMELIAKIFSAYQRLVSWDKMYQYHDEICKGTFKCSGAVEVVPGAPYQPDF